jgi:hypothetical protein
VPVIGYAVLALAVGVLLTVFAANVQLAYRKSKGLGEGSSVVGVGTVVLVVAVVVQAQFAPEGWRPAGWMVIAGVALDLVGPLVASFVLSALVRPTS